MSKYNIFLKCVVCNKESAKKEYDESEVDKIMSIGTRMLKNPNGLNLHYLVCPYCQNLLSVIMAKEEVK